MPLIAAQNLIFFGVNCGAEIITVIILTTIALTITIIAITTTTIKITVFFLVY